MNKVSIPDTHCRPVGFFEVLSVAPDGEIVSRAYAENIITYTATNIMARSLAGQTEYVPTHILVGGKVPPVGAFPTVTREDTVLSGLPTITSELPIVSKGFTSVPTSGNSQPLQQNSNVVTFTAVMSGFPADLNLNGKDFFEAGIILKLGAQTLLFSHQFHTPIAKLAGFQLIYNWSLRFL